MPEPTTIDAQPALAIPSHAIQNVRLEPLEAAVYRREHETAGRLLLDCLRQMRAGAEFIGYPLNPTVRKILVSRLCAAIVALLADPKMGLSQDGFDHLAAEHAIMDLLFRLSIFETSDHMMPMISTNPAEGDRTKLVVKDGAMLVKYFLTFSLRSSFGLNYEETFKRNPQALIALWAGMVAAMVVIAVQAHERREVLVGLHGIFRDTIPPDGCLPAINDAYMYASYATRRDKHAMKGTIHRILEAKLRGSCNIPGKEKLALRWAKARVEARPTVLVALEWFSSLHAMFRCYAPAIRQLRKRFRLVGVCRRMDCDEGGIAEFDEFIEIPMQFSMPSIVDLINRVAPAAIFHPSLGMSLWWTCAASLRLAPLQCMTLGHPSSSQSRHMDYVLCDESAVGDPSLFTERLVTYPDGGTRFVRRPDARPLTPRLEDHPETINVAIPSMMVKLTAPFMQTLAKISERSARPVVFHFFINMLGVTLQQAAAEIRAYLPTARAYERNEYNAYMEHLRACDLHLASFPFGGTNSDLDSMTLGIPIVCMDGDEPHSRFDGILLRRIGLGELVCANVEEYIELALALIEDDARRNALRDRLLVTDLEAAFFGEHPGGDVFGAAFSRMFDEHTFHGETIQ